MLLTPIFTQQMSIFLGRYLELKDKTSGQLHSITSADLQNSTWSCLRFWYVIGLGYLANLRVGVVGNGYGNLWSTTKSSDGWSYVQVPFNKGNSSYKVIQLFIFNFI